MEPTGIAPPVVRASRRAALALSLFAAGVGGAILVAGWILGASWLTSLVPGAPTMKANTATMQMLIGLALAGRLASAGPPARFGAPALAGVALLIAGLSFLQIVLAADFGIDELLARDTWSPHAAPGLMSTATSVCGLLVAGLALIVGRPGTGMNIARLVGTWGALLIVLVVLCVYLFDLSALFTVAFFETMSLPTAIGFLCLIAAAVLADPERGLGPAFLSDRAGSLVVRRLVLPIVAVPIGLGYVTFALVDNSAVALAIMTVGCISVLCIVTMVTAREVDRHDRARREALEDLQEALQQSETASLAKSRFLANVSHDLRTPLNAIIGLSEAMSSGIFGELEGRRYQGYASEILRSGRALLDLINTLLDVAQIESQDHSVHESECDVAGLCAEILHDQRAMLGESDLTLENAVSSALPRLRADSVMLRRIVTNLVDNAVKFTPAGGYIAVDAGVTPENALWVRVSDTGPGINPTDAKRLQEPFEQGHVSPVVARNTTGIGLGLSIVKHFATLHGAAIGIENAETGGLQVRITFPADRTVVPGAPGEVAGEVAGERVVMMF